MKYISLLALALALPVACDKGGKKDPSTESGLPAEQPTDTATDGGAEGGTDTSREAGTIALDLSNPTGVIKAMGSAMVSVAEVKSEAGVTLNPGTIALSTGSLALAGETCKNSGSPNVDVVSGGQYAAYAAYCDLSKHPDGPDTTLGGIDRVQGVLCALEGQFQYDGKETAVTIDLTEKCFSKEFVSMAKQEGVEKIKQIVVATEGVDPKFGNAGYQKAIDMRAGPGEKVGFIYHLQLAKVGDVFSVAISGGMDQDPEQPDAFAISLDTSAKGSIRYEGRFTSFKDDSAPLTRHLRVLAQGAYDAEKLVFSSVDQLEYLYWDVYKNEGQDEDLHDRILSVKGSPGKGYMALELNTSPAFVVANYVPSEDASFCYAGTCEGNNGLYPMKEEHFAFPKHTLPGDATFYNGKKFFLEHGPLKFDSVQFTGEP